MKWIMFGLLMCLFVAGVSAVTVDIDDCHYGSFSTVAISFVPNVTVNATGGLTIIDNCTSGTGVEWIEPLNLAVLGDVVHGDVAITPRSIFVDTAVRPDMDFPARLTFRKVGFAVEPQLFRNGQLCDAALNCTAKMFDPSAQTYSVIVGGFSNYSLENRHDFTVNSDPQPELESRVYQTIDLNDSYRSDTFKCIVQIYGLSSVDGSYVLVQTNPERNVAAHYFGSPDMNNPESLGYFKTESGLANVYFDGSKLSGYANFEYVAQCANNSTKLVYEEALSTRYSPAGRGVQGRFLWLTDGNNAFYSVIVVVFVLLALWVGGAIWRTL